MDIATNAVLAAMLVEVGAVVIAAIEAWLYESTVNCRLAPAESPTLVVGWPSGRAVVTLQPGYG